MLIRSLTVSRLACSEPSPQGTQRRIVSREPGYASSFACSGTGSGLRPGNQSRKHCIPPAWPERVQASKRAQDVTAQRWKRCKLVCRGSWRPSLKQCQHVLVPRVMASWQDQSSEMSCHLIARIGVKLAYIKFTSHSMVCIFTREIILMNKWIAKQLPLNPKNHKNITCYLLNLQPLLVKPGRWPWHLNKIMIVASCGILLWVSISHLKWNNQC